MHGKDDAAIVVSERSSLQGPEKDDRIGGPSASQGHPPDHSDPNSPVMRTNSCIDGDGI
jgi:hypothetical protein